ncbi:MULTISPECIES: hypothetical protein [unclassified Paenibacillus]|uniref:hypothetical protein n=1 Tax=Paenibacillus TaxID=44249 RepID=UPI000CFBA75A|nr:MULTISPECIES: hypothetical protein [unclassified Paenibacillus]
MNNMEQEFYTRASYLIFSEDTTYLKAKDKSNFMIFSPKISSRVNLPCKFKFHLSMGLISPKEELNGLEIRIYDPYNDILDVIEVGKLILEQTDLPDDTVFSGNFSIHTDEGIDLNTEGFVRAELLFNETVLSEATTLVREEGGQEDEH